jgi:hypothetical protein
MLNIQDDLLYFLTLLAALGPGAWSVSGANTCTISASNVGWFSLTSSR